MSNQMSAKVKVCILIATVACLLPSLVAQIVINTWPMTSATSVAYGTLTASAPSEQTVLDAVENGLHECELSQCMGSVGFGGSPNERNEVTLDALLMSGQTFDVGAVGMLKQYKGAINVARAVMEKTYHTLLVGDEATQFARRVGFDAHQNLSTPESIRQWNEWVLAGRIPNFWRKQPPPPPSSVSSSSVLPLVGLHNMRGEQSSTTTKDIEIGHDTIALIAMDREGRISCGTSTNALDFRIPGRVGDSPIPGAGSYCEQGVGGAGGTGNGDYIMRFLPSIRAVMYMKLLSLHPRDACQRAMNDIWEKVKPEERNRVFGGLVCVNAKGQFGAAAIGKYVNTYQYTVQNASMAKPTVFNWRD